MRILWTHNFDPTPGNRGSFMNVLAKGVRDRGVDLDLHHLGPLGRPDNLFRARTEVSRMASGYDLVHAQFGSACAVATAGVRGRPKLLSLRGSDWYRYQERLNREALHAVMAVAMSRSVLRRFDAVVVMSERMRTEVSSVYRNVRVETIPDPIDLQQFVPMDRQAARTAVGLQGDSGRWVLFTTLSTCNPIKRVPLAQRAVELANQRLGNVSLRVATGIRHDQMPVFVAGCNIVLSTSVHEGWPNAVKEALACNIPFVATDVSDLRQIAGVEPSCRVCRADPEELAAALCEVLESPQPLNLRRHLAGMDLDTISGRLVTLYRELIERSSAHHS